MALKKVLILRRPQRGRLEGRTLPIQPIGDFFTRKAAAVDKPVAKAGFIWVGLLAGRRGMLKANRMAAQFPRR
jgi:hypothetical protein